MITIYMSGVFGHSPDRGIPQGLER